ncbi:MAG: hypothetical protein II399_02430 [Lachnospiraceae bacterium]|nr:hypothetical protein [Lachnospiraceae bacterium]
MKVILSDNGGIEVLDNIARVSYDRDEECVRVYASHVCGCDFVVRCPQDELVSQIAKSAETGFISFLGMEARYEM